MLEYAIVLALIALLILGALQVLGKATKDSLCQVGSAFAGSANQGNPFTVGDNSWGELGTGWGASVSTLGAVSSLQGVASVSVGQGHELVIKADCTAWAWGTNTYGELGIGNTTATPTPVQISTLSDILTVSAGGSETSYALKVDGTVWSWGANNYGQLGYGSNDLNPHSTPAPVPGLSNVKAISTGGGVFVLALKTDGSVWSWGYNADGELGNGATTPAGCLCISAPAVIPGLNGVIMVAAGPHHSAAVLTAGSVKSWGLNVDGELGLGSVGGGACSCYASPQAVAGLPAIQSVAVGGSSAAGAHSAHSLALSNTGTVYAWGDNGSGELGLGDLVNRTSPTLNASLRGVTAIVAGGNFSAGVGGASFALIGAQAWAWGGNTYGQLGVGDTTNRSAPVAMLSANKTVVIAGGDRFTGVIERS